MKTNRSVNSRIAQMQKRENQGFVRAAVGLLIFAVCIGTVVFYFARARRAAAVNNGAEQPSPPAAQESVPQLPPQKKTNSTKPVQSQAASPVSPAPQPAAPRPEPLPFLSAETAMQRLASFESLTNALTFQQVGLIDLTLKQLAAQGSSSIPTIAAYLEKLQDVTLDSKGLLKAPTLRAGLIDALNQIGGPEAMDLMQKTLQGTADPFEIGLLARCLQEQAPGKYDKDVIDAAGESLKMAGRGELGDRDVAPLFQALRSSMAPEAKAELEATGTKWNYYSSMALAALPDGSGISSLVARVQDPAAADTTDNRFAWQMIAQMSTQSQEAQDALLRQAQAGKIPDTAWPKIITGLTGDQYKFGDSRLGEPSALGLAGLKTYHIRFGNQNFYSLPLAAVSPNDIPTRQSLIDTLLKYDLPAATKDQLRQARTSLNSFASIK